MDVPNCCGNYRSQDSHSLGCFSASTKSKTHVIVLRISCPYKIPSDLSDASSLSHHRFITRTALLSKPIIAICTDRTILLRSSRVELSENRFWWTLHKSLSFLTRPLFRTLSRLPSQPKSTRTLSLHSAKIQVWTLDLRTLSPTATTNPLCRLQVDTTLLNPTPIEWFGLR